MGTGTASREVCYRPFIIGNGVLQRPADLRDLVNETGYLFLKGLVDAESVRDLRRGILDICRTAGWVVSGGDPLSGQWSGCTPPVGEHVPEYLAVYRLIMKLPAFQQIPHHPRVLEVAEALLQGKVLVHPRKIGRVVFPRNVSATTPPHQDFFYIRGTRETWSAWMPIGNCPRDLGGLAVLRGSHKLGFLPHIPMQGTGGHGVELPPDTIWDTQDFAEGDVIFFHSHTVHKALPNLTSDQFRISVDNRYQIDGDEIDPGSLKPHFNLNLDQ